MMCKTTLFIFIGGIQKWDIEEGWGRGDLSFTGKICPVRPCFMAWALIDHFLKFKFCLAGSVDDRC